MLGGWGSRYDIIKQIFVKKKLVCSTQVQLYHALRKAGFRLSSVITTVTHAHIHSEKQFFKARRRQNRSTCLSKKGVALCSNFSFPTKYAQKHVAWNVSWKQKKIGLHTTHHYLDRRCLTNLAGRWVGHICIKTNASDVVSALSWKEMWSKKRPW